jgi:hypothetical protein
MNLLIHGEMSNTIAIPHLQQLFFLFLLSIVNARSLVAADVSTMFNDIILRMMTLEMCSSGTPQSISNVEVGEKIFGEAVMVFNLQAQQ